MYLCIIRNSYKCQANEWQEQLKGNSKWTLIYPKKKTTTERQQWKTYTLIKQPLHSNKLLVSSLPELPQTQQKTFKCHVGLHLSSFVDLLQLIPVSYYFHDYKLSESNFCYKELSSKDIRKLTLQHYIFHLQIFYQLQHSLRAYSEICFLSAVPILHSSRWET